MFRALTELILCMAMSHFTRVVFPVKKWYTDKLDNSTAVYNYIFRREYDYNNKNSNDHNDNDINNSNSDDNSINNNTYY